jgi:hypothetical protein
MGSAVLAVVAALGASALTALASLGVTWYREHLSQKAADRDTLSSAVIQMLSRSMSVMVRAQAIGLQMRFRSGLKEGTDVTLGIRKAADVIEMHDWLAADYTPLAEAWSVIWARGDQETVRLANQLLTACGDVLGAATAREITPTLGARILRWAAGEKLTPQLEQDLQRAVRAVAHAREQLAQHSRTTLGLPAVHLFGYDSPQASDGHGQDTALTDAPATGSAPPPATEPQP